MKVIIKKALCLVWVDIWAYSGESHTINHSSKHQRSVTITLIDLENAFGEVRHSLIQSVLRYHDIPDEVNCTVRLLYCDFRLSTITNDFCTKHIAVEKGVQGDSISPLVVKSLDSQSRGPVFKTAGWLQGRLNLSSFRGR